MFSVSCVPIKTLSSVKPKKNWLHIFDIDDTIMKYNNINEQWWITQQKYYMTKYRMDKQNAFDTTIKYWKDLIKSSEPLHVDKIGIANIINQIKQNNDHLILLTYRSSDIEDITKQHLQQLNIDYHNIYMTNGQNKGIHLVDLYFKNYYKKIDGIIYVDDKMENINDIIHVVNKNILLPLDCYHIKY